MKKLAVIVAVFSIVALAVLAYGEMEDHRSGMMCDCDMDGQMMGAEHHMSKHLMVLNLDDQQRTLIGEIKSRMMKDNIRRTADMRIVQIELKDLLRQDPVDMKAVEVKLKQSEMMRTEMQFSHINALEDIKAKLTPEQQKKFREMSEAGPMKEEMGMKHEQKRGMKGE